jgi:NAD(P)-dependent dehydrogenase (short-subunit alcohol dehydrogenase family)
MSGKPDLAGQTVVVIGGSSGIGLETARLARGEGAQVILTARDPDRLHRVGLELGANTTAFDATNFERLGRFFDDLPTPIDHALVTGPGPYYAPLAEFDVEKARRHVEALLLLPLQVARSAATKVRAAGTLPFMGGTGGRPHGCGTRTHLGSHGRVSCDSLRRRAWLRGSRWSGTQLRTIWMMRCTPRSTSISELRQRYRDHE